MSTTPSYLGSLQPFIVLDKNQFPNSNGNAAVDAIAEARRVGCGVLVTDEVFVELLNAQATGKDWKDQFEKDFRDWANDADLLSVGQGLGELLRLERDTAKPAIHALVDPDTTDLLRQAVKDLATSGAAKLTKYDGRVASQLGKLQSPGARLDPAENLKHLRAMVDFWHKGTAWKNQADVRRMLQSEVVDKTAVEYSGVALAATSDFVLSGLTDALVMTNRGYTKETATRLMSEPSFTLLVWTAREAIALYYYALGRKGEHFTKADEAVNQTLDTVYLGYGLACQQLRTRENVVRRLDSGLRRALTRRWP